MAISEKVYGKEHPDYALKLNNLAQLLQAQVSQNFLGTFLEPPCC